MEIVAFLEKGHPDEDEALDLKKCVPKSHPPSNPRRKCLCPRELRGRAIWPLKMTLLGLVREYCKHYPKAECSAVAFSVSVFPIVL